MGFQRDGKKARAWAHWLKINAELINEAHCPALILETEGEWLDFLMHGYHEYQGHIENPLVWFNLEELPQEHLTGLLKLVEAYPEGAQSCAADNIRRRLSKSQKNNNGDQAGQE